MSILAFQLYLVGTDVFLDGIDIKSEVVDMAVYGKMNSCNAQEPKKKLVTPTTTL